MSCHWPKRPAVVGIALVVCCAPLSASETVTEEPAELWQVRGGTTTISLHPAAVERWDLQLPKQGAPVSEMVVRPDSDLSFTVVNGSIGEVVGGRILHVGSLALTTPGGSRVLRDLILRPALGEAFNSTWTAEPAGGGGGLLLVRVKAGFDRSSGTVTMRSPELRFSPALAKALGEPGLADAVLGSATVSANVQWIGGARPEGSPPDDGGGVAGTFGDGPDMTFCQLYGLYMPSGSREGDIVGLSVATTSWNIGNADLMWFNIPDEEHPFIVMNMYRLRDDRLVQIGQSHIKHGFYALGSHQCGGPPCSFEPGHGPGDWLGQNCTDTYSASLNAVQSGMGPKYEVNPWTGYWYYPGSHMQGGHNHDNIQHRIQVHDADLDPAQNAGAQYYCEGYYVILDDIDVMNSASWKPVTVSGSPGGSWSFGMSAGGTMPEVGFAIDAWAGATKTLIAQEIPVEEFVSPDGRCVLAATVKQLGEQTWHYEYAVLNVDMDRQVGAFSIPVSPGTSITNVGFHAVEHHDEPFNTADPDAVPIDNEPWTWEVADGALTWSTESNPLRWGTMYNFWFDADAPSGTTMVTVGHFRPGEPESIMAETRGPVLLCPADVDLNGTVDVQDLIDVILAWGDCDGPCPADVNGDGTVDVLDMVAVILAWGPC